MTSPVSQSSAPDRLPQYSATVLCGQYTEIRLTQLVQALKAIVPASAIGDWAGPFKAPPADALGTDMLSIDGISLTLLNVDKPLPAPFFETGPIPNQLVPNPLQQLGDHRAHVSIIPARQPLDGPAAVATARAVTLLTLAVAILTRAEAIKWTDSNNFVPMSVLQGSARMLSSIGSAASSVWIRILAGRAHDSRKLIAGSYGLWAFGLPEIEYAPIDMPIRSLVPHAWAVCDHIFRSGNAVKSNDTIDVDGKSVFKVELIEQGFFGSAPVLRLSWLASSKSFDPGRSAQ